MAASKSPAAGAPNEEEIERLASRLAMLVSDAGEADNAGRAVGALARRLGISGGQLKAIFMAGAASAGPDANRMAAQALRIRQLEQELAQTRIALQDAEADARAAQRERDVLRGESDVLQAALSDRRAGGWTRAAIGAVLLVVLAAGLGLLVYLPNLQVGSDRPQSVNGVPTYHEAVVHDRGAVLRRSPDADFEALMRLAVGTHLVVQRVLWYNLMQWIEVEYGGQTGYVQTTEVDLS